VSANPNIEEPRADLVLAETGSIVEVPLDAWNRWVRGEVEMEVHHPLELGPLEWARRKLMTVLPTSEAVRAAARGATP
jgi:hypothetical protein